MKRAGCRIASGRLISIHIVWAVFDSVIFRTINLGLDQICRFFLEA